MSKKVVYVDMDNVVVDFQSSFQYLDEEILEEYKNNMDEIPNIFSLMHPMDKAIESVEYLAKHFEVFFLSTSPWDNNSALGDKLNWIKKYFPEIGYKRLILSHNKHLNIGDYLIDDRLANGADRFTGKHIHFGTDEFKDWNEVIKYIKTVEGLD